MQIILLERVEKLGQMGDVVTVKPGYARNFLLPQRKAMRATKNNIAEFESRRKDLEAQNLEQRKEAESVAEKMVDVSCILLRQAGDSGQLYGSVSARDIADSLKDQGISISRQQVVLDRPIKTLGIHDVKIALHPEVGVNITVNVARSAEEAEHQVSEWDKAVAEATAEAYFETEELAHQAADEMVDETESGSGDDVPTTDDTKAAAEDDDTKA